VKIEVIIASLLLSAIAATSIAQGRDQNFGEYIRCVGVAGALSRDPDPNVRIKASVVGSYFVGEIYGASPDIDWASAMKIEKSKSENHGTGPEIFARCSEDMLAHMHAFRDALEREGGK